MSDKKESQTGGVKKRVIVVIALVTMFGLGWIAKPANATCDDKVFGAKKVAEQQVIYADGKKPAKPTVSSQDVKGPFNGIPPEILAIRSGAYSEYVGGYINDGKSSWLGIDLDAKEIIWITRRVWDAPPSLTQPFKPFVPGADDRLTVVRSWQSSDGKRKEEVVVRTHWLDRYEMRLFLCLANSDWLKPAAPPVPMPTDTISSFYVLVSFEENQAHHKRVSNALSQDFLNKLVELRTVQNSPWRY